MDFFNKMGNTISSKSKDVAKKAKELAEISSLNGQITTQEDVIKKSYLEIGKYVYENMRDDAPDIISTHFNLIEVAQEEIVRIKEEILAIKGIKKCPECNHEIAEDAAFCPQCGFKVPDEVPEVVEDGEVREIPNEE